MDDATRDRLRETDALASALATALERAEAGDGTVCWTDVADDVPAEQWGKLLETGLLVSAGDRFVVEDPTAARELLDDRDVEADRATAATDTEDSSWSRRDKAAGLCSLALMASYQIPAARDAVGATMHAVLGPVEAALPFVLTVALLALAVGTATTLLNRRLRDTGEMERVRERVQTVQDQLSDARDRGDDAAVERLEDRQRELMGDQLGMVTSMLRPMAYTVLLTAPVFLWLSWLAVAPAAAITPTATVFPFVGRVVWTARLVGPVQAWMVWYFVCSLLGGTAVRRVTKRVTVA